MKILFDQGAPVPLRRSLHPHEVDTAAELGWSQLSNGDLIESAEKAGYEALITTDGNLRYQQNLSKRTIIIIVLTTTSWPRIRSAIQKVRDAIDAPDSTRYQEIQCS